MMRTVVITGASAGVGRAAAIEFARHGCRVGLIARDRQRLEAARADVEAAGGQALVLPADVADFEAVERAADRAAAAWGAIDVWVNCAMATVFSPVHEMTADEYRRVTEVTYLGFVHGTLAALKYMRPRDQGTIVQVGSALAYRSIPLQSAYCGAKFAVRGFTDSLRCELRHDRSRIRLSMVQMPGLNTPQFDWARSKLPMRPQPVAPVFQPEVAARAIFRAARTAPRELWVGRSSVAAILGNMLAPGLVDRILAKKAFGGQMSNEPALERQRSGNLYEPVAGLFGAHGRFDRQAAERAMIVLDPDAAREALGWTIAGLALLATAYAAARGAGAGAGTAAGAGRRRRAVPGRVQRLLPARAAS
jgi:NAD(P)-dependent dehydrogenase (short-subunit alcohol dehydrogenase family)